MKLSLLELLQSSNGWVVRNLREYGNSLLPKEIYDNYKPRVVEGLLSVILEENVEVIQKDIDLYVAEIRRTKNDIKRYGD